MKRHSEPRFEKRRILKATSHSRLKGELDRLEGPGYAARRAELRRKAKEAERTRERQAAAAQDEAEENDATEEEVTRERK